MDEKSKRQHDELVELAKDCLFQSRATKATDAANEFRRMARQYQRRAAELDGGKLPDIGDE